MNNECERETKWKRMVQKIGHVYAAGMMQLIV